MDNHPQRRFYGRRQSRPLNKSRADSFDKLLPVLSIAPEKIDETAQINPAHLFDQSYQQYWLEIGFGSGEHLSGLMRRHPDRAYIGAEPYVNGMAAFLKDIQDIQNPNVCVHMDDALMLVRSIMSASLDGLYILNPDPWHKKRHHKRRIVRPETLDEYARILKPGADLILSTDVPYLADWMITHTARHPAFEWTAQSAQDWENPPADWITTAYEVKGAKGAKKMAYLFFKRK